MNANDPSPEGPTTPSGEGPPAPDAAPPPPRFCTACGSALATPGGPCGRCDARARRLDAAEREAKAGGRPVRTALGLYAAILGVHLTAWVAAEVLGEGGSKLVTEWWIQGVDTLIVFGWCLARRRDLTPMLARGASARWFAAAFLASFLTWGVATLLMEGVRGLVHAEDAGMIDGYFEAGYGWGTVVASICLQPGIVEELAFRGVILGALLHVMKPREAVLASAIMFAGLHLNPITFPHLIVMGTALGLLQVRTGSVYPGMVLHFCHNLWCCLAEPLHLFGGGPHDS